MNSQRWRTVLWAAMLLLVFAIAWRARTALIPFTIGALLAYTLTPVVDLIARGVPARTFAFLTHSEHQMDVFRRGISVMIVYLVIGLGLFGVGTVIVPLAVDQTVEFVDDLPELIEDARIRTSDWLTQYRDRVPENVQEQLDGYAADAGEALAETIAGVARRSVRVLTSTLGIVFGFVVVPIWMFYALRDRHTVAGNFMQAIPQAMRADVENILSIGDRLLLRYIRGQVILGVIVGTAVGIGLTLMDVQLSLALGVIAGITELIPIIGPWIGAVPGMLIIAGTDPDKLPWVALLYFGVQMVENNFLVPRVQGQAVDIHPAMVILLLVVAGAAFGFIGLIVVVPLTAILRELFWYADRRLTGVGPAQAFAAAHIARVGDSPRPLLLRLFMQRSLRSPTPETEPGEASPPGTDAEGAS